MHTVDDCINLPNIAQTLFKDIQNVQEYVSTRFNVYVCDLNILYRVVEGFEANQNKKHKYLFM